MNQGFIPCPNLVRIVLQYWIQELIIGGKGTCQEIYSLFSMKQANIFITMLQKTCPSHSTVLFVLFSFLCFPFLWFVLQTWEAVHVMRVSNLLCLFIRCVFKVCLDSLNFISNTLERVQTFAHWKLHVRYGGSSLTRLELNARKVYTLKSPKLKYVKELPH